MALGDWLRFGCRPKPAFGGVADARYTPTALRVLTDAGWQPGRTVDPAPVEHALASAGYRLNSPAVRFLAEFHGLELSTPIDDFPDVRGFVHVDPIRVLPLFAADAREIIDRLAGESCCLVGTASGHTTGLFVGESGRVYLLDHRLGHVFAPLAGDISTAVELLCGGRNGRVESMQLREGRPTGVTYRAGEDRDRWDLGRLPDVSRLFPPTSLEPALRPPDVLAMPKSVQDVCSNRANQTGGFATIRIIAGSVMSLDGRSVYFIAHTENAMYIRDRGGFPPTRPPKPGVGC